MASLQAHLAAFMVRRQVKRRLGDMSDLGRVKAVFEGASLPAPRGVRFRAETLGGVPGEWAESDDGAPARATLLYLHGGGYIACSARTHRPITGWFARHGFRVFAPDYRLAPEHPFPAAVEDAVAAWRALQEVPGVRPGRVVVAGDSAGGNLALALMLTLQDAGGAARPSAAALFSPATDFAGTGASMQSNARRDAMFPGEGLRHLAAAYLGGADPRAPLVSPLYADLAGLPPLLIHAGEREVLRDDATRLAERARAAGVAVELRVWPVVPHVWQLAHAAVPEARRSLEAAAAFLHQAAAPRVTASKEDA
jgi:monoterpene epsilon-lactone hydrolase